MTPIRRTRPRAPRIDPLPPLERNVQAAITTWLKVQGWNVWQTSNSRKIPKGAKGLRPTEGIPDLYALHPHHGAIWIEVKRDAKAPVSREQHRFRDLHESELIDPDQPIPRALIAHSLDEVRDWFRHEGWSKEAP